MIKHHDPETDRGKRDLNEQQANAAVAEEPGKREKRNRKRGPEEELPKIRGLPPKLALGVWPTGLIEAGHNVVVEVVELRVCIREWRLGVLPQEDRRGDVRSLFDEVGEHNRVAGDAPVVIRDESDDACQYRGDWEEYALAVGV